MTNPSRIRSNDVHVRVRPEEIDSIMGLRTTFDYFEILGKYVSAYLELDWMVKLVIPHLDIALDVDFRQVRESWNQGLTDLAVKGIHTSLMVYTGPASNLMVLEVQGNSAEKALVLGRDWRARCIMQVGEEREQHFFAWPQVCSLPAKTALEAVDMQVFGEGGKIALPPSQPGVEESIRWLVPPWEDPPCAPTPRLMEFLHGHSRQETSEGHNEDIPAWEEILTHIAAQARLMRELLTPTSDPEGYYRSLLREARVTGLMDRRLLLGLLWHAPLGTARHDPQKLSWLRELIQETDQEKIPVSPEPRQELTDLVKELSRTLADLDKERQATLKDSFTATSPIPAAPAGVRPENESRRTLAKSPAPTSAMEASCNRNIGMTFDRPAVCFVSPEVFSQGEISVNRKHYEAMIYELGRLAALQKFNNQAFRETKSLKEKIDAQRQEEINHLRQLVRDNKTKKWW